MDTKASKVGNKLEYLQALPVLSFMDDQIVKEGFISLYRQTHPDQPEAEAEIVHSREAIYFKKILIANPKLQTCSRFSLYSSFMDIVTNGMTFDPAMKLIYIQTRGYNIAPAGQTKVYEQRAENKLTAEGELNLRMQLGQIKYCDTPVIVFQGDVFRVGNNEKGKYVIWEAAIPRTSKTVVASFIKVTRPDGSVDYSYLTAEDIERFRLASQKQNSYGSSQGSANELYTSCNGGIDPGFLATKTIRHAFRVFPKAKVIGTNTTLDETDINENTMVVDAGQVDNINQPAATNGTPAGPTNSPAASEVQENKSAGTITVRDINF